MKFHFRWYSFVHPFGRIRRETIQWALAIVWLYNLLPHLSFMILGQVIESVK